MSDVDFLKLDGAALRQFLYVYDTGSVSQASERLGIGQSAVSHTLDRLRKLLGDPLFVRQGRGITPTERAHELAPQIRDLLPALEALTHPVEFTPTQLNGTITLAAEDYERELLGPGIARQLRQQAPETSLRFLSPGPHNTDLLRQGRCDLMITPNPPDGTEFIQRRVFENPWVVFHDPSSTSPRDRQAYCDRPHAKVVFSDNSASVIDRILSADGKTRQIKLMVPSFTALPGLMRGTDLIVTLPNGAADTFMQGFATCPLPYDIPPLPFFMVWHQSQQHSAKARWLRDLVDGVMKTHG